MKKGFAADIRNYLKTNYIARNIVLAISVFTIFFILAFVFLDAYTRHGQKRTLPNFSGMTIEEALPMAEELNLKIEIADSLYIPSQRAGIILDQNPKPGNGVKVGRRILVTTNTYVPKQIRVPYVVGLSLRQAKNRLLAEGIEVERIEYRSDMANNNVLDQYYQGHAVARNSDMKIPVGSKMVLVVGSNTSASVAMPNLIGVSLTEAKSLLWENGFNVGKLTADDDINYTNMANATVYSQSVAPFLSSSRGITVDIAITVDPQKVQQAEKAFAEIKKKVGKINDLIVAYRDTLDILLANTDQERVEIGDQLVSVSDTSYYRAKIEELRLQLSGSK